MNLETSYYDIFISYKSEDIRLAQMLNDRLVYCGFRVWFDKIRLKAGFRWHEDIEKGCEGSRIVLPVLTPRWRTSEWTKFETYGAETIIPLLFEGRWDDVATPPLQCYQYAAIDLRTIEETNWIRLFDLIRELLAQPEPSKTDRLANLKYRANPNFVGREKELNRINECLHQNPSTALTLGSVLAIPALGGVGKTTLARQYAEKFWRLYPQIFWIDAHVDIVRGYAAIARILFPNFADQKDDALAQCALQALSDRTVRLLILDDVEDEEAIQSWIPKTGGCHTIITSRFAGWSASVETVPIYLLDPEPSRELLLRRSERKETPENIETCDRLAAKLDFLPLALEQAAVYIKQEGAGFGFADYLDIYDQANRYLLDRKCLGSTQYPDSVITTWKTTLDKLSWDARAILRLSAFLSSKSIPKSIVSTGAATVFGLAKYMKLRATGIPHDQHSDISMVSYILSALKELANYSMVFSHGQSYSVHSLVQTVERIGTLGSERKRCIADCIRIVRGGRPEQLQDVMSWPNWNDWVPHALTVIDWAKKEGVEEGIGELYSWAGTWLEHMAYYSDAESLLREILDIDQEEYGKKAPVVATRLNNLAGLLRVTNRLEEAEKHLQRALEIAKAAYGIDHDILGNVLNNLGLIFQSTGRLQDAETSFRKSIEIARTSAQTEPMVIATRIANLAGVMLDANQISDSKELLERVLEIEENFLGHEHPQVAKTLINLSALYVATNRLSEAEKKCKRALAINKAAYGSEHPEIAICMNDLALVYQETKRLDEAELLLKKAHKIDLVTYGPNHENVAIRLNNLAGVLKEKGRIEEAERMMRRSLRIREKGLGPDNPLTFHMYSRLAGVLMRLGKYDEAEDLARRSIHHWLKSETPRAFKSGRAYRILAWILYETERNSEAVEVMQQAMAIYHETLVTEDPRLASIHREMEGIRIVQRPDQERNGHHPK